MAQATWQLKLTQEEADTLFLLTMADDTEDAPWTTLGDLQFWSASSFAHSLRAYAHARGLGWYVASMLPILCPLPDTSRKLQVSPDAFVAFVPEHPRQSFDATKEGGFPPFVLEVVSPSSVERDEQDKLRSYALFGAREYAIFTPRDGRASTLAGYRRDETGQFVPWAPDDQGRLWSETLGLFLIVRGPLLQGQTAEGQLLPTPEQSEAARLQAEDEVARLRGEMARPRGERAE